LELKDTYRHKGLRKQLMASVRSKGITDKQVLAAMSAIPRHFFLEKAFEEWAYQDKAFPIGNDQTISQPFTVAYQTQLLNIKKRDTVMEIGTGSGYQAAILAELGARVYTIERQELLHIRAKKLLKAMGYGGIRFYFRDGYKGLAEFAPFNKIIVTAGAPDIPEALKMQLKIDGCLVIPVGGREGQKMMRITRTSEKHFKKEVFGLFGNFNWITFIT